MIQSDGVNSRWKKYADTEPAETVEVTEEPSLEVPVVESPSQSQEKPPVSNRWSKYATGPTTPAETIPSRPATPAMAAQAATTARQQAAEPPKQEAFEDVPKEIASFKFNPEVENMIIGDDIAANTGLYAMNRGNVKGYYKTNDVVKGVVADLETKANQLKIDYEAKVAQLNETTKAEQEKLNAEFSQKDAEIEKGYAEAVKAAKTPEEKALADKNYELDKNALNAEFKAKADSVGQKLKGEYDKAYADLTKSMEDLSSYTKDWETPEGFGKWYEDYEKENRAIGDSERKSIQEVIKAMPNDYEGKKAALQRFTNSYLDAYDGQPEYDQVKGELYDIIRSETLFDAQGNPTPYALKNQAEIEKRSMADEYNRLNAEFKEITKGVPTGYGSDMYYLALNKIPGAREMQTRLSYLSQAINNFERISKLPESEMKGKRAGSFMEGMGGVKNLIPNTLSAGLLEQMESVGMLRLAQKVKHGQALTEDEQLYLDSVSLLETTVQLMRPDFKNWYLAGRATGESLPWITNMIATGGAYSWGKLGMMKVLKSAGYREGRKWSAKTIGKTILTEAAGSASRIPFQPSFYQNIAENIAKPESVAGEMGLEGKMKATGKTMAGAVVKASYMQFAENFSEISGTYMDAGGKAIVGLVAKKLGLNVANAIPKTKLVSAMGQFGKVWSKFRDVAKISSIPAEYGEEIFANVLHLVDGTTKPSDIVDLRENWITFLSVASMVGPMQVVSGTAKGTAAVITKQDLAKGMQEFFSGQQIKEIDRIISIQDVGKKTDALLDFIQRNRVDGAEPLQSLARYVWDEQLAQGAAAASEAQDAPATTDAKAPLYMVDKKTGSVEEILDLISTAESTADLAGITIENDSEAELELSTKFNKLQEDERFNEAIKGVTDAAEIERLTDEHVAKLEEIDDKYKADFEKIQEQKEQPVNPEVEPKVETVKPENEEKLAETEDKKAEPQPIEGKPTAESEQKKETVKQKSPDTQAMMEEVGVTNPDVQKNIGEGAFSGRVKFVDVVLAKGKKAGEVIIESIRTPKLFRRMGRAGKAMAKLTESADKHGVTLRLKAKPEQGSGISQEQLVEFYKKHGFMFKEGGIEGVRTPWDKKVTVAEPAKKEFERLSANATGAYPSEWVQSQEQLPVSVKNAFKATGQKGTIDGVFDPVTKKVWFVADIVKTADDVSRVWTHEQIGHRGVRLVFPKKKDRDAFYEDVFKRVNPERIREVVSKSEWDVWESSKKDAPDRIRLADEYVAYLSEKVVNKKTMTVEEKSIWKQIVAMVRKAMAKMLGKKNVNELTDDDIAKIINQSLRAVYPEKKGGAGYAEETGKGAQEKGAEVGAVEGEAGRLRVRDDERDGLEAEEGEKIDQKQKLIEKGINFVNYEKGRSEKYEGVPRKSTPTAQEMGESVIAAGGFRERSIGEVRRVGERDVNIVRSFIPEEETVSAIKEEFKDAFVDDEILEITGESEAFHYFISKAKLSNKYGASVYVYAKDEYADMRLFSTPDGNAGFAIKSDGDFVSVFSSNVAGKKYRIPAIMILGIKLGGIKLDCFNTILPDYYAMFGFKPVSRVKFDPQYAPEPYKDEHDFSHDGWDYQRFKPWQDGKPDVVYFVYDGGDFKNIEKRIGKFSPYTENSEKTIKYYPMDKAMEIQARAVSEIIQKYNLIRVTTDTGLGTRFSVSDELAPPSTEIKGGRVYKNSRGEEIRFRSVMPKDNALQQKYRYKPKKDNEIFTGMERQIGKVGFMNLTGPATINSPEDVAFLFRNLESAAVENAFVVMMDKDGKYVVLYVGTGNTVGVVADPVLMATAAKEFGAERIVFVHNHPSGNLSASDADMNMHEKLVSACEGICDVLYSVIIDLDKGMFGTFRSTYRDAMYKGDEKREELPVKMFQFNKQILYSKSAEWVTISGSPDVATYLSRVKRGVGNKTMVIIMNRRSAITRTYLSTKLPSKAELIYMAGKHGESIILSSPVSPSTSDLKKLKVDLQKVNISLLDFIEVGQDPSIVNSYKSYADYGLMEPSPKYVEEIPRFSVGETIEVDGVMRPTTNSEGRPIHPTQEGVRNFWKWFLDSVTVNKKGHPIVFYHNTDAQFTEFDTGKIGTKTDKGFYGSGFYFTSGVGDTHYGEIEMGVYLKIESPYYKKESHRNYEIDSEKLKSDGHDGAIVYPSYHDFNPDNPMEKIAEAVVYEPEQIKSATDNTGTFSEWTADIRFRATPSVPPAPNQFIDDILNTLVSKGALSPKRRDAILQKFRFIPNIKTLPQDEQDFTFIKMLLDEGRINLSKGLGELSSIITRSLNNIRRDEKEMVTDGQYRSIINRLGNADTVKKMQALLDYVFETVILGRGAKYKAALKMAQKWQGKIADKNKGEKSQFGTARAMANNVEAIDLKQLSFEELEEFSDIASRMFLSPRSPSIPHIAMLDNMFWTRLKPEKEKKEPTPESITDIISAIQSLDPGTITDIPTYISFRRALNRYAKQAADALASATPDVIEELETNLNDTIENIEKAIEESIKTMTEELEDFRKAYGVHLVRRLKQADTRNGAKLLESPEEMAVAEELINMQTKDIMDMDINMLAEFETTINNLREGHITPGTFDVIRAGRINRVIRLTLDPAFNIIAQDKTGIWRRRQRAEGRRGVQTLVPKTFRKRDFFNELVRQFKSKQPFRIDNFLGNFSETKKIAKTITDVGRFITMAEIDKQHYDKSAGKAYEIFYKGKSAKEQEKWRKWIFYYMATLRWQSSRFSEKTPNIFHAVYDKLYDVERSKVNDPNGFDNDAKVWGEFMDFLRSKGALNPADENGAETMKEAEAEAVMREDVGVAALIDWVNATVEQYKGMNKVSAGYNGRSLIWGENYVPFMRKYKNDNIESETNIASWLNRAMFNANFVAGSTYEWRGNPMYMEDDIVRVMGLYTEMMRRNYFIYPSFRENVTALKESSRKVHTDLIAKSPYSNGNNISLLGRAFAEALRSRISSYYNSNYMIEQSVALKKAEVAIKKTMLVKIEKFLSEFSVNISRIMLATMNIPVSNINRLWKNYDFWGKEINSWINKGMWSAYSTEINYSLFGGKIEAGRIRRVAKGAEQFADWMIKAPDMGAGRILFVHSTLEKFKELTGEEFDEKKWQESWSYRQKWTDAKDEAMYFADTRVEELFNSKNPLSEGELKSFIGGLLKTDRRDALGRSFSMLMSFGQNDTNQIADSFRRIRNGGPKARLRAIRDINALFMSNFMYAVIRAWAGVMSYKYMYKPAFDAIGNAFVSAFGAPGGGDDDEVMTAIEAKDKEYMDKKTNAFKSGDYYLDILKYKVGPDFLLGGSSNIVEYGGKWLVWIYDRTIGLTDEQREAISAAFYQRYIMLIPHSWGDPEKILIRAIPPLWETAFEDALSFAHSIGDTIMGQTAQSIIEAVFDAEESGQLTKKQVYDLLNLWFTASKYLMFFHPAIPIAERQIRKELRYLNRVAKEEKKEGKTNKAGTEGPQEFKPAGYPKK